ncbi:peptide MFS transporter [Apibacter sp. HY039]|uniref:peptide MFS transporter n=1 Tax=Apibacter sp. HY039 TaxID=2501476 RepID=UPI000FEBCF20|nr:peptide MFS transporter [Apibacter sp. HY039]
MDKTIEKKSITLEEIQNFKGRYPKQLWYLALAEMWERFTFYGMRALLALYIAHLALSADYKPLSQADIEKKKIEFHNKFGQELNENNPKFYLETTQQKFKDEAESKSNKQYGLIQAFIYAMAFVGGIFADKLFGFRKSVFWGGILMAIGTFTMAIPGAFAFYLGVSILIVGNGFFKPNISTMVGALYKQDDSRRDAGFSVFYMAINVGALLSGLTIGYIGTAISWSLGFALSGVCMLFGLILFHFTQKKLGPIGLAPNPKKLKQLKFGISINWLYHLSTLLFIPFFLLMIYYPFDVNMTWLLGEKVITSGGTVPNYIQFSDIFMIVIAILILIYLTITLFKVSKDEFGKMFVAIILILFSVLFFSFFEQGGGSLNFFAVGNIDGHGLNMTQVNNSINSLWVIIFAPILGALWIGLSKNKIEPNTIIKFGLGFIFLGLGFFVFYISRFFATFDGFAPLWTFVSAYLVITIGELCLSPIGLSMITKLTPIRLHGMMMGTWFLASAYGQYGAGLIGSLLSKVDSSIQNPTNMDKLIQYTNGYQSIAYVAVSAGIILLIISPLLSKIMSRK